MHSGYHTKFLRQLNDNTMEINTYKTMLVALRQTNKFVKL